MSDKNTKNRTADRKSNSLSEGKRSFKPNSGPLLQTQPPARPAAPMQKPSAPAASGNSQQTAKK